MNLPSDVTLPELKLHLEFKDPNDPFKNSVKTSKYFSDVNNYRYINAKYINNGAVECKDSTFIVNYKLLDYDESVIFMLGSSEPKASEPFYLEYYARVIDRVNNKKILIPWFEYTIYFTDNLINPPADREDRDYFGNFYFQNHFVSNICNLCLIPWCYGNSKSEFGPTFESINDGVDKNIYFDVNSIYMNTWPYSSNGYEASIPLYTKKDPFYYYSDILKSENLKEYLNIKDIDEFVKCGFLTNLDSNNFIHIRYYINDTLLIHLKSKQTHLPSNITKLFFRLDLGSNVGSLDYIKENQSALTGLKDLKLYCHIDNDEIGKTKKNIQDGAAGTNWFNSSIKVIEDPSLKSKEEVEDEINKQLSLNPYIDLNELQIFAKINDNNLYPVTFAIQDGKVHIKYTDFIAKKQLYIGSKRQFIHHQYIL